MDDAAPRICLPRSWHAWARAFKVRAYRSVPWATLSRIWGRLANIRLARWMRKPVLGFYARTFGVNVEEAASDNLSDYSSIGEFFRRPLKPGARPIDASDCIVSPADGKVLHFGAVDRNGLLGQVKGVYYSLRQFLGPSQLVLLSTGSPTSGLHYCVIYLAPGDYHRFHSPVDWDITLRRHFPGELLSVKPSVSKWVPGLLTLNERAVYFGQWQYGFFSMTAVGATNVGSIHVYKDQELETNSHAGRRKTSDHYFRKESAGGEGFHQEKGELFGEFNFGSTIVLIFQAPKEFRFTVQLGQIVRVGQAIAQNSNRSINVDS